MLTDGQQQAAPTGDEHEERKALTRQPPTFFTKFSFASHIYSLKGMLVPIWWLRDWSEYFHPPPQVPDIVKTYECRPHLPVR